MIGLELGLVVEVELGLGFPNVDRVKSHTWFQTRKHSVHDKTQ